MGATNHTPNYNLPQFIGTDKPTWLSDVNGAFSDIDTQMKANATSAAQGISDAGAAASTATSANNKANTLDTQINTPSTGLAAVVSGHTTDISSINSAIGSTPLPTTAQTLTGAIDEVYDSINRGSVTVQKDGTKTYGQMLDELYAAIDLTKITKDSKIVTTDANGAHQVYNILYITATYVRFIYTTMGASSAVHFLADINTPNSAYYKCELTAGTTVFTTETPSVSNKDFTLYY